MPKKNRIDDTLLLISIFVFLGFSEFFEKEEVELSRVAALSSTLLLLLG